MPKEKPIFPSGWPNPVGPPIIEGTRDPTRIGGNLPQERYPLVSRVPPCLSMKHKQVTLREWDRLANLLTSNEQGRDNSEEKKQKLKAASEELQRGWPDTSKEKLRRLAESMEEEKIAKLTSEQQENDRILEEKHRARLEKVERAVELIKKSNDERFYELKRGLILSETVAQREKDIAIKHEFAKKLAIREAREEAARVALNEKLEDSMITRELERQQTLLDVKKCQEYQMEEKRVKRAHDRKISECYKYQAIGMADDARDKAAMDARDKTELVQGWGKQYLAEMEDKKARKHEQDLQDKDAAAKAKCQDEEYELRKREVAKKRLENTVNIGKKQHLAASLLKKDVFDKIVDNTDRDVAKVVADRNREADAKEAEALEAKKKIAQGLNNYYHKDYCREKAARAERNKLDKELERQKDCENFNSFLDHIDKKTQDKRDLSNVYKRFWDDQCSMMAADRQRIKDFDKAIQDDKIKSDLIKEDEIERLAEKLISQQKSAMKPVFPIEKSKSLVELQAHGKPTLVASDASGIRLNPTTANMFYRPEESRNRLSINWDPAE